ncbi:hypothetical protein MMS63_29090, partial [Escherichia coli]|nr:hypothetical protein [Escherichia coli]
SLGGIAAMETLLPALFHLLLAGAIRFCKLNNPMMSRIATDLRSKVHDTPPDCSSVLRVLLP